MVFALGVKTIPDIIDDIANGLIASIDPTDGLHHWTDADIMWNTSDRREIRAKRALKYENGPEIIYLALESKNTWYVSYDPSSPYYSKGLRITFSATWDSTNHSYGSTVQQTSIPFETYYYTITVAPTSDLAAELIYYYTWIESNGFVIMAKPEPTQANDQNSFFVAVERNPNKEYVDGYSNFYCYNSMNLWPTFIFFTRPVPYADTHRSFLRPFAYEWPQTVATSATPFYYCLASGTLERDYNFVSPADQKFYYRKPIISNNKIESGQANVALSPIFTAELWFPWSEMRGIVDGDIIQIEGTQKQFLCKSLDSPDGTARITYAMRYF